MSLQSAVDLIHLFLVTEDLVELVLLRLYYPLP